MQRPTPSTQPRSAGFVAREQACLDAEAWLRRCVRWENRLSDLHALAGRDDTSQCFEAGPLAVEARSGVLVRPGRSAGVSVDGATNRDGDVPVHRPRALDPTVGRAARVDAARAGTSRHAARGGGRTAGRDRDQGHGRRRPAHVFAPSIASRMMSAWPACCAVSAMMWSSTRRADHDGHRARTTEPPGASCSASRSTSATSASVLGRRRDVGGRSDSTVRARRQAPLRLVGVSATSPRRRGARHDEVAPRASRWP